MLAFNSDVFVCLTMETILEFIIFFGFLYWAFPGFFSEGYSRVNKMVDVVTNRMFDTFNRFSPRENSETAVALSTISNLKRFAYDQKYKKALTREADIKAKEAQLFAIKEHAPEVQITKRRPFMGLSCENCTLISRESLVSKTTESLALRNILNYELPASSNGFLPRIFSHLHQVYQLQKFDYPQLAEIVLRDERLKHAIEKTAVQQFQDLDTNDDNVYQELLTRNQKRGKKLLYDMRSTLSDFLLRFTSWVLYKLLPCFLTSVVAHPGQVEMLKKVSKSNLPLIFLPLHRSHLDYILISFILLNNNIRSPLVAAGDNLRIPFFGSLLRGLGAFFIKRRIDPVMGRKDHVYKTVLHTYMNECLRAGHNMEFFLEGGRTRTGKPCMPKYGILSVIVDTFMDGTIEDAILVPVSVNYEKLVDGNFVREQLGQPKEMETFSNAIRGIWNVLNSNYGMMRIDFNQPFSLRELVKTFNLNGKIPPANTGKKTLRSNPSTTSLYGTDVVSDEHKSLVESISKHIIYDCAQSTSIMSTNALAFLLLTKYRNGATLDELVEALNQLQNQLNYDRRDIGFTGDPVDVINYAITMLGPGLVQKEKHNNEEIIKPITMLPNVIELSYYSNTLVTHFALESIIANVICTLDFNSCQITPTVLVDSIVELCDILQYEFILSKPCQSLEQIIKSCVDDLNCRHDIFEPFQEENIAMRRIAQQFDDDDDEHFLQEKPYIRNKTELNQKYLEDLRVLVMPLVEAYAMTAFSMEKLVGRQLLESELLKCVLDEMKLMLESTESMHRIFYGESISVDAIKNALKLFQKWDYLECHSEKKLRLYYMKDIHDNKESVRQLYKKIYQFRETLITQQ